MSSPLLHFHNPQLLTQALTHRSYRQDDPQALDNERLEFLGDAILNYLSGAYLYQKYPHAGEDQLTRSRSALVDEQQLAQFALAVGLDQRIRLSRGLARSGGTSNPNLLSSAFEAVVGAFYCDRGSLDELQPIIEQFFASVPDHTFQSRARLDPKNQLQEWAQANFNGALPQYQTGRRGGADHAPTYLTTVSILGQPYGEGRGNSKKSAEKQAAIAALNYIATSGQPSAPPHQSPDEFLCHQRDLDCHSN